MLKIEGGGNSSNLFQNPWEWGGGGQCFFVQNLKGEGVHHFGFYNLLLHKLFENLPGGPISISPYTPHPPVYINDMGWKSTSGSPDFFQNYWGHLNYHMWKNNSTWLSNPSFSLTNNQIIYNRGFIQSLPSIRWNFGIF